MRNIDTNILTALLSSELRPFTCLKMTIDGTDYCYTDCDIPLVVGDDTYQPRGFEQQNINYSINQIVDQVTIEIDNLDQVLTPVFVGGTPQGSPVVLLAVVLDDDLSILGNTSVIVFEGEIGPWGLAEDKVDITVTNQFAQWAQSTLSRHSASCRWKVFKGDECGYSGSETWCDRTYARCESLGNQANFGGFRWLPSIMDTQIWWGRVQGEEPS